MNFRIAIPTYNRSDDFKTLSFLKLNQVSTDMIDIFVADEDERVKYVSCHPDYNYIIGELGLVPQRNFISQYYNEGQIILSIDDDIIDLVHKTNKPFLEWVNECIEYMNGNNIGIIGLNPSVNPFFFEQRKEGDSFKKGNYSIVGCFQILINHRDMPLSLIAIEDWERSVMYKLRYGSTGRYNDILIKTKYFNKKGGLATQRNRENYINSMNKLLYKYPEWLTYNYKKLPLDKYNEMPNTKFRRHLLVPVNEIVQLPLIPSSEFSELYCMLENIYIPKKNSNTNRRGFPDGHVATTFGYTRGRFTGKFDISLMSRKHPEIYNELLRIGNIYCPFKYTSIHVNRNVVCPKHKDGRNIGKSMLVSFGDYSGCNIVIEGNILNADCQPIIFNGAKYEHWNTDDLIGQKYSLVYYNGDMSDKSDYP